MFDSTVYLTALQWHDLWVRLGQNCCHHVAHPSSVTGIFGSWRLLEELIHLSPTHAC